MSSLNKYSFISFKSVYILFLIALARFPLVLLTFSLLSQANESWEGYVSQNST